MENFLATSCTENCARTSSHTKPGALQLHSLPYVIWTEQKHSNVIQLSCFSGPILYRTTEFCALLFLNFRYTFIFSVLHITNCPCSSYSVKCGRREAFSGLVILCPRHSTQHHNLGDSKRMWRICFCPGTLFCVRCLSGSLVLVKLKCASVLRAEKHHVQNTAIWQPCLTNCLYRL